MNTYEKYKNARDLTWHLLIDFKLATFPIDIKKLITDLNINLVPYKNANELFAKYNITPKKEAFLFIADTKHIFYDDSIYIKRIRFTLAHELGHIMLDHIKDNFMTFDESMENEANIFASRLLAPAVIAWSNNLRTVESISTFFDISTEAATIRFERLNELYKRNKFLTSPLEKEYFNMYLLANGESPKEP